MATCDSPPLERKLMKRREFVSNIVAGSLGLIAAPAIVPATAATEIPASRGWRFSSSSIEAELSPTAPGLVSLNIDCLALGKRGANVIEPPAPSSSRYTARASRGSDFLKAEYRLRGQPADVSRFLADCDDRPTDPDDEPLECRQAAGAADLNLRFEPLLLHAAGPV